jgi:hypothetical protein
MQWQERHSLYLALQIDQNGSTFRRMFLFLVKTFKYIVNYYLAECFIFNKYILIQKGLLNILICDRKN